MAAQETHALPRCSTVVEAINVLSELVERQNAGDAPYFRGQRARYLRSLKRVEEIRPAPCRALDIGSHYLHQSVLLSLLGYEVWGIDVELFTTAGFVAERSKTFNIRNMTVNVLENGDFLKGQEDFFDLVLFTETIEHITFNPIRFWRRVYELLSPKGTIYLTTPNSLRPAALARTLFNMATFRGIGLPVEEIFQNVTYGHHWKEYSAREIQKYFRMLSNDFGVETSWYSSELADNNQLKRAIKGILAAVPCFRSDLEAVIRLSGKTGFSARIPQLPMHSSGAQK